MGESDAGRYARRPESIENDPPNCPPTSVLLVLKMKFLTTILATIYLTNRLCQSSILLPKSSLYTQGDREGPKLRDQAVSDLPAAENDAAIARTTIHYRFVSARAQSHVFPWVSGISRSRELTTRS